MPKPKLPAGTARVKINVTISPEALKKIDAHAKAKRMTRSRALEDLIQK